MKTEKKKAHLALGISNLIASVVMLAAFSFMYTVTRGYQSLLFPFLTYTLPFMVIAILMLICGVFGLKGKNLLWGLAGIGLFLVGVVYFMVMAAA